MKTVQSKDGTTIAYDTHGHGPALIFITGAICFRKFSPVEKDAKTIAKSFTVYNYDRRGRGDSTDKRPYDPSREVEDIEALIDAAGGSAFVYGHSSGAVLALEAALALPQKVRKVALLDASYAHDAEEKKSYGILRQKVSELVEAKKFAQALKTFLVGIGMPKVFVYLLPLFPGWKTMKALAPTLEYDMHLTKDLPPLDRAAKVLVPALVLHGEKSPASLHSVASQLAKVMPSATLHSLKGQDHMAKPEAVLPELEKFFI